MKQNRQDPIIAWCSEIVKRWEGQNERFYILSMTQGEHEILSFQISETEARESYGINLDDSEHVCERLAAEIYNGWFTELKRRHG